MLYSYQLPLQNLFVDPSHLICQHINENFVKELRAAGAKLYCSIVSNCSRSISPDDWQKVFSFALISLEQHKEASTDPSAQNISQVYEHLRLVITIIYKFQSKTEQQAEPISNLDGYQNFITSLLPTVLHLFTSCEYIFLFFIQHYF